MRVLWHLHQVGAMATSGGCYGYIRWVLCTALMWCTLLAVHPHGAAPQLCGCCTMQAVYSRALPFPTARYYFLQVFNVLRYCRPSLFQSLHHQRVVRQHVRKHNAVFLTLTEPGLIH